MTGMRQQTAYEKCARRVVIVSWIAYTVLYVGKKTLQHCLPGKGAGKQDN